MRVRAIVLGAVLLALGSLVLSRAWGVADRPVTPAAATARLVSLAPSITQTLVAIGAGRDLVGVSDHCTEPSVSGLARAGSWLTPNYEGVARLDPTLVLTLDERSGSLDRLKAIAPTRALPWLSASEMVASVRTLGEVTGRREAAAALAQRIERALSPRTPRPASSPVVLMVIGDAQTRLSEVWFIRPASIHGAVLEAAGAKNAVAEPIRGPPRLSLAQVVALDPDAILILAQGPERPDLIERHRRTWSELGALGAVRQSRIAVVAGADVHSVGPDVINLVPRVAAELRRMFGAP
jgi:iron complex transport system substrate-binding protein